jgi:hypothetical protein
MRTTLTLEDDLVAALKERARVLEKPFKQVVNDVLRLGLGGSREEQGEAPDSDEERPAFEVKPICSGFAPGVDPLKLKQLNADLEDAEVLRKMRT